MKRRQLSFPVLRFAAAAFVAASTTVHAGSATASPDGRVEAIGGTNNTEATANSSSSKEVATLPSLTPTNTTSPIHNDSSPPKADIGADEESETADLEDEGLSEVEQLEPNDLWENESGIVYGGFGWRHDKRGGEGGGGGSPAGGGSRSGPGAVVVMPPPFLYGGHYPKKSSGAGRPRPFGLLRG
ncbi:hypothetical protein PG996_000753 [Apiospora saccharicola]|uniref:Uncharacterized protein n=1 Tax=Apiospora saccharicola TaxID=335842 RepID=A0ABR1WEU0_9PEZI